MKNFFKKILDELTFLYTELKKTFSLETSFFSSKKIERSLIFISTLIASNYWFWTHVQNLSYEETIAYTALNYGFIGYVMSATQKEKRFNIDEENKNKTDEQR